MSPHTDRPPPRFPWKPFGVLVVCAILWPAVVTFDAGDWPSPHQYPPNAPTVNACGVVGAWCGYQLKHFLGDGAYPLLLFATIMAIIRLIQGEVARLWQRIFGLALLIACTSATSHAISSPGSAELPVGNGGVIGFALAELMAQHLSRLGTLIVVAASLIVSLVFVTDEWVLALPALFQRLGRAITSAVRTVRKASSAATPVATAAGMSAGVTLSERAAILDGDPAGPEIDAISPRALRKRARDRKHTLSTVDPASRSEKPPNDDGANVQNLRGRKSRTGAVPQVDHGNAVVPGTIAKPQAGPVVKFPRAQPPALTEAYPREIENWRLPSVTLLQNPEYGFTAQQEMIVREQAMVIERTLEEFRLDARVVEIDTGPVITMFELKLGAGIKVSQIAMLANDMARALKSYAIRVVAPIPGKNTVGIEVPNVQKEKVRLKDLLQLSGKRASQMDLPLFLGKDAGGAALVADLTGMPHLLIAGTTGSGKSVCLNAIILSILMTKRPDHVKLILIDPKMVELSQFKDVPHLMCPLVTDMVQAERILGWAVTKMDERYELLAETRVKNISAYNALGAEELYNRLKPASAAEKGRISTRLPYIVVIIDELADLMMTSAREVEHHLSRLAQKSRAVGIHIIVATQRPEVKVVTGLIKSNLPSRICFRVSSRTDSRIVLDQNGGEVLLGQGDMLYLPPGSHKLLRAQGTYMEEEEVQAVLADLAGRSKPEFHPELATLHQARSPDDSGVRDALFDQAVGIVLESKRGSVSLLQRRLTIGYARASRLIEEMADAGVVGAYKGSQAREINMTMEQWETLRAQTDADA